MVWYRCHNSKWPKVDFICTWAEKQTSGILQENTYEIETTGRMQDVEQVILLDHDNWGQESASSIPPYMWRRYYLFN